MIFSFSLLIYTQTPVPGQLNTVSCYITCGDDDKREWWFAMSVKEALLGKMFILGKPNNFP